MKLEALLRFIISFALIASTTLQAVAQDNSVSDKVAKINNKELLAYNDKKTTNNAGNIVNEGDNTDKPNVIIILTDDQGYGDLSVHGNPVLETPNIDKLHHESIRFKDFHVAPMCTPTRSELMTGKDALSNGAFMACSGYSFITKGIPTMADIFKANGYKTGLFGKWHLGDNYPYRSRDRGFDETVGFKGWGIRAMNDYWNNDGFDDYYWHNERLKQYRGYNTSVWFSEAMKWMRVNQKKGQPFFTYLALNAPHAPWYVTNKYKKPYKDLGLPDNLPNYFGMIASIDENVGRLNKFLKKTGLKDNTILIYMSDNGAEPKAASYYNAGMRGHKGDLYEGGHRALFFLRWLKGKLKGPRDITTVTEVQDVLPTLIDLVGLKTPVHNFDGIDLVPLIKKKNPSKIYINRMMVIQYGFQPWRKLSLPKKGEACVLWKKWRLLVRKKELYNVSIDPGQKNNVAGEHPGIVAKLQSYYERWWWRRQTQLENPNYIWVGTKHENPVILTAHDWLTMNTANSRNVRLAANRSGAWNIDIKKAGEYKIALYRWPKEANAKLREGIPSYQDQVVDAVFPKGEALPIDYANLRIGGQTYFTNVTKDDSAAVFNLYLNKGKTQLQTWFYDKSRNQLCGAYYVYITLKN